MSEPSSAEPSSGVEVDVAGALALINAGADVVDVRRPVEFLRGHALRARNVALADVGSLRGSELPVLCLCAHGIRSRAAAEQLRAAGVEAYVLAGGLSAWQRSGQPLFALGGGPGEVE